MKNIQNYWHRYKETMSMITDTDIIYEILKHIADVSYILHYLDVRKVCKLWNSVILEERTMKHTTECINIYCSHASVYKPMYIRDIRKYKHAFEYAKFHIELHDLSIIEGIDVYSIIITNNNIKDIHISLYSLHNLDLSRCKYVTDLSFLKGHNLHYLNISWCTEIADLTPISGIHTLIMIGCVKITDVTPLKGIHTLDISGCNNIMDLTPIKEVDTLIACSYNKLIDKESLGIRLLINQLKERTNYFNNTYYKC